MGLTVNIGTKTQGILQILDRQYHWKQKFSCFGGMGPWLLFRNNILEAKPVILSL